MKTLGTRTLGDIVADNFRAATVFEKYGIDFCCQGNRNLSEACTEAGVEADMVAQQIDELEREIKGTLNFNEWPLDLLADHIFKNHHQYLEQVTPTIKNLLEKVCHVHGDRHPELLEIKNIFVKTSGELAVHMKKEELVLFPFIKKLALSKRQGTKVSSNLFDSVSNPIKQMNDDHLDEGEQLERMTKLSNNFTVPEDACMSYRTLYQLLKEYEHDMHIHIHLENNILFPKAVALEHALNN